MAKDQASAAKTLGEIEAELRAKNPVVRVNSVPLTGAAYEAKIAEWKTIQHAEQQKEIDDLARFESLETKLEQIGLTPDDIRFLNSYSPRPKPEAKTN